MSDSIRMEIDSSALAGVNSLFLGLSDGARKTLATTMNEVVKAGKKIVVDEINSVVTLKKDPLNKEIRYTLADAGQAAINALITASGKRQRLINYSCQQNQAGVSVQIYRDKPRSVITGSFMSTIKSGHKGVFQRHGDKVGTGTATGRQEKKWGALPRKYRLPIEELYSSSVEDWFGNARIMQTILFQLGQLSEQRLSDQVDQLMREVA